ncbi:heterokaryon incompatibility protein-domain-containing protein [Xylaria grammica]|nr:heterokaryon incompatibility protein-domain-containing protein [Xylaria grammica]
MGKISLTSALLGGAILLPGMASADRACSSGVSPSYLWRVSDARFDGSDPSISNGKATVAVSIIPNTTNTFFECVAQWPESWAGWLPAENIIWSDCIWSGAGPTLDTAVAFALDWKTRTMYLSHTFSCSDKKGSDSMATGSFNLDLDCKTADDETTHCTLKSKTTSPGLQVKTVPGSPRLAANATCDDNTKVYQSWQLENWHRQYKLTPGDPATPPPEDSGPSFTLRNLANGNIFECVPGNKTEDSVFEGACTQAAGQSTPTNAKASFRFDPVLDMLVVTESWDCGAEMAWPLLGQNSRIFRTIKLLSPVKSPIFPFKETLSIEIIEANVDDAVGKYDTLSTVLVSPSNNDKANEKYPLLSLTREDQTKTSRPIFADQICINQADNFERVQQVRLMGDIYAGNTTETRRCFDFSLELNGTGVLSRVMGPNVSHYMNVFDAIMDPSIELGTEAEQEDRNDILDLIARYGPQFPLRGLTEILRRAWINRLWTVQEGCLPANLTFHCGEKSLCYDCLRGLLLFYSVWTTYWLRMPKGPVSREEIRSRDEIYSLNMPLLRLVKERKMIHKTQSPRKSLYDVVVQYNVNDSMLKIGATKAEDRIYALLGLAGSDEITRETVEGMEVDNVRNSYTKFAASVIKRNVDVLLFSQFPRSRAHGHQLPSWVPDWSADPLRTPYGYLDLTTPCFSAGGERTGNDVVVDESTGTLRMNAIPVGRVIRVGVYSIQQDKGASVENIEYKSVRLFFDELDAFMELASKINPAHAPDISDEQRRRESMIRLSDSGLSARQFPARFNPATATAMLERIFEQVSHWGAKLIDVEARNRSMRSFTGMLRSAGIMPWYWTPASEIDVIRQCALDPITAARVWMEGLFFTISDVGWVLWYIAKLQLYTAMIKVRRTRPKDELPRPGDDIVLEKVGLANDLLLTREWELYTSNLFKNIGRKLFLTETGYVGLGPCHMEVNDSIVVIPGGTVPHVLRPHARSEFLGHHYDGRDASSWSYVGEAYCDGIMDGQLVAGQQDTGQVFEVV